MTLHHRTKTHHLSSHITASNREKGEKEEVQDLGPANHHLSHNLQPTHHLRPSHHLRQHPYQRHSHKVAQHLYPKGTTHRLKHHNITTTMEVQVVMTPLTTNGIITEVVIKATEAAEVEEDTEGAGVAMEVTREEDSATYVKMTQDSSTFPEIVQTSTLLHSGETTLQPQVDATAAPVKYTQVNASNHKNVHFIQVRNTGPTYAVAIPTLVKMHDNHSNK